MDWILANGGWLFGVATVAVVVAWWFYRRYAAGGGGPDFGELERDLRLLAADGLGFLKSWAGDQMQDVAQEEVWGIADIFFDKYVSGTPLEVVASRQRLRDMFWDGFCRWRDQFVEVNSEAVARGIAVQLQAEGGR